MGVNDHTTDRWKLEQRTKILRQETVTHVFARKRHAEWLRATLLSLGISWRTFEIGEARIITTDGTVCPCCRQRLESHE
jgi:hypothetical protein